MGISEILPSEPVPQLAPSLFFPVQPEELQCHHHHCLPGHHPHHPPNSIKSRKETVYEFHVTGTAFNSKHWLQRCLSCSEKRMMRSPPDSSVCSAKVDFWSTRVLVAAAHIIQIVHLLLYHKDKNISVCVFRWLQSLFLNNWNAMFLTDSRELALLIFVTQVIVIVCLNTSSSIAGTKYSTIRNKTNISMLSVPEELQYISTRKGAKNSLFMQTISASQLLYLWGTLTDPVLRLRLKEHQ